MSNINIQNNITIQQCDYTFTEEDFENSHSTYMDLVSSVSFCITTNELYYRLGMKSKFFSKIDSELYIEFEELNKLRISNKMANRAISFDPTNMYLTSSDDRDFAQFFFTYWSPFVLFFDIAAPAFLDRIKVLNFIVHTREDLRDELHNNDNTVSDDIYSPNIYFSAAQPDNDQPDNDQPDNDQPDNDQPDNDQPDNDQPDNDQPNYNDQPNNDYRTDAYNQYYNQHNNTTLDAYNQYNDQPNYHTLDDYYYDADDYYYDPNDDNQIHTVYIDLFGTNIERPNGVGDFLVEIVELEDPDNLGVMIQHRVIYTGMFARARRVELESTSIPAPTPISYEPFAFSPFHMCCTWTDQDKCEDVCEKDPCPICFDHIHRSTSFRTTCGHIFCDSCIEQSVQINERYQCPMCRGSVSFP
jgi:hypothetical protein